MSRSRILPLLIAAAFAMTACDEDPDNPTPVDPGPNYPPRGALVSGDLQQDTVGDQLPLPLVVRVTDQDGRAIAGTNVTFTVTAGGGTLFAATAETNAAGEASNRWTLGTVAGDTQRVEARVIDPESGQPVVLATFRAVGRPDAPATITARPPAARTGSAGQPLADSLEARVQDQYGNGVPGVPVVWLATSGGGTISPATTTTRADGTTRAQWTLGNQVGTQQVAEASLSPAVRAQFTATAGMPMGAVLVKVSGDGQTGTVGAGLPEPIVVELRTSMGQPLAGVPVSFTPATGSGFATPPVATTGPDGRASTAWTLGVTPGQPVLMASADGVSPVTFTATANPGAAAGLTIVGGNGQTAPPTAPLPQPLAVRVADAFGNPLPGVTVTWTVTGGGGSIAPATSQTGPNGVAQATWTMGPAGPQTATASAPGTTPVTFTATSQVGPVNRIEVTPASLALASLGETAQLTARAVDAYGNTVPGVTITWTSLNPAVATVSSTGLVTAVANGTTAIRASGGGAMGQAAVTVQQAPASVTVTSPRPTLVEGDTVRLTAVVRDARGNVISGAPITWTSSAPATAPISSTGLVTAQGGGTPTFTATTQNGVSGSRSLTLQPGFKPDTLAVGAFHSCGLQGGTAYCWGGNQARQLGFASPNNSATPRAVAGHTFASITAGDSRTGGEYYQSHTCGVEPDGDAFCWGNNESGQLGYDDGRNPDPNDPDGTDNPACGVAEYGFICTETPTRVEGVSGWRQLDAGTNHTCGITTAGTAYCWGKANVGALGTTEPVELCHFYEAGPTGYNFACALTPKAVAGGMTFRQISAGEEFTCALTGAGAAWCWGNNTSGQLGDGTTTRRTTPVQVLGGHTFARISAGRSHVCGVTTGGTVYCWGSNASGRLGIGTITTGPNPAPLAVAGTYQTVAAGNEHTCAITSEGRIACWGDNARSQIGDGTTVDRPSPTLYPTTRVFRDVGAGYNVSCAQRASDGAVFCWGRGTPANELGGSTGPARGAVRAPS